MPTRWIDEPQPNTTQGGDGFCALRDSAVGTRHRKRSSTLLVSFGAAASVSSRKISRLIERGCGPMYSGIVALSAALVSRRVHDALLVTVYCLGLNWNLISPSPTLGELRTLASDGGVSAGLGGSTTIRLAFSSLAPWPGMASGRTRGGRTRASRWRRSGTRR